MRKKDCMEYEISCETCAWQRISEDAETTLMVCGNPSSKFYGMVTTDHNIFCEEWREMEYYGIPESQMNHGNLTEEEAQEYVEYFKSKGIKVILKEQKNVEPEAKNDTITSD